MVLSSAAGDDDNNRGYGWDRELYCYRYQLSFIEHILYARCCDELFTYNVSLLIHEVGIVMPLLTKTKA